MKEDFEKRKKAMVDLQKKWQDNEARSKKLDEELAGMYDEIAAAKGDEQARLKIKKAKLTKEKSTITDVAGMKVAFEAKKKEFDKKEAELAVSAKEKEDDKREKAYDGVKLAKEEADLEFKKAGE